MISKTSFFNKGIYKSTLKRFAWGSVLYFVALFLSTTLAILISARRHGVYEYSSSYYDYSMLFSGSYIFLPILMAIAVPTVVAIMLLRFIHSKNQAIFVHSLPVSKRANYISSILAGFTLMLVPLVINGLCLMAVSLGGFEKYFTVYDCVLWIYYNAYTLFIMFSCAIFAASITGNSFAAIVINFIIHVFPFIIAFAFDTMAQKFVFGYDGMENLFENIANNNFAYFTFGFTSRSFRNNITLWKYIEFILASLLLYAASYFAYKNRRIETAGDVAGFKSLNAVFKYFITFLAAAFSFAVFSSYIEENVFVFSVIIVLVSICVYIASEMVLKKTLSVLYSFKGYGVFAIAFGLIILFMSQTTFFGYETRIPQKDEIESASIYEYYYRDNEPFTKNKEVIDKIINVHKEFTEGEIPTMLKHNHYDNNLPLTHLHIKYKLKSGKTLNRDYTITKDKAYEIMNKMYENESYKKQCEFIFINDSDVSNVFVEYENKIADYTGLIEAIRKDVLSLEYETLYSNAEYKESYSIKVEYNTKEIGLNKDEKVFINHNYISVTPQYENAFKWLDENGYSKYKRVTATSEYVD